MSLVEFNRLKKYYQSLGLVVSKGTKLEYLQKLESIVGAFVENGLSELLVEKTLLQIEQVYNEVVTGETVVEVDTETINPDTSTRAITTSGCMNVLQSPIQWENSSPSTQRLGIYFETVGVDTIKVPVFSCPYPRKLGKLEHVHEGYTVNYVEVTIPRIVTKAALANRSFSGSPELGVLAPPEYHANYTRDYNIPYSFERLQAIDLGRVTDVGTPGYSKLNKKDRQSKSVVVTPVSKKTKSKINWGTKSVGTYGGTSKSSTTAIKANIPLSISTQSRWFSNPLNQRYCWRIKDSLIYQMYENSVTGYEFKAIYIDGECTDWIPVPVNFTWNNSSYHDSIKQQLRDLFPHEQYKNKQSVYKESISARERENLVKPEVLGEDEVTIVAVKGSVRKLSKPLSPHQQHKQNQINARKEGVLARKYPQKKGK
jgi:hypothetical protein